MFCFSTVYEKSIVSNSMCSQIAHILFVPFKFNPKKNLHSAAAAAAAHRKYNLITRGYKRPASIFARGCVFSILMAASISYTYP